MNSCSQEFSSVYIAGIGILSALGANAVNTSAAVKAGVSAYQLSDFTDSKDKAITMANVSPSLFSSLEMDVVRNNAFREQYDHIIKMAVLALQDAFMHPKCKDETFKQTVPLILAMPEPLNNVKHMPTALFIKNIVKLSGLPIEANKTHCVHYGRAAGIHALELARRHLFEHDEDYVLIGGSHSYINYSLINHLNDDQRLLTEANGDGFAPGEAAGFLLLTRHPEYAFNKNNHIIKLHQEGTAEEDGAISADIPYKGEGLDKAFKSALKDYSGTPISTIFSSMNGENFWAKEQAVALIRNKKQFKNNPIIEHPADCYGDLATATAPVLMGLSALDLLDQKNLDTHLIYSSSDGVERAAVLLEKMVYKSEDNGRVTWT